MATGEVVVIQQEVGSMDENLRNLYGAAPAKSFSPSTSNVTPGWDDPYWAANHISEFTPWSPEEEAARNADDAALLASEGNQAPDWWGQLGPVQGSENVRIPKPHYGTPPPNEHMVKHPRSAREGYEDESARKVAGNNIHWDEALRGRPPDRCYEKKTPGGKFYRFSIYYNRFIRFKDGTKIRGVGFASNLAKKTLPDGTEVSAGPNTTFSGIIKKVSLITGKVIYETAWKAPNGQIMNMLHEKDEVPCPPPSDLMNWHGFGGGPSISLLLP